MMAKDNVGVLGVWDEGSFQPFRLNKLTAFVYSSYTKECGWALLLMSTACTL